MIEALVLVGVVWAVLMVPAAIRSRRASPHVSVGGFERAMEVLRQQPHGPTNGRTIMVPDDADRLVVDDTPPGGARGAGDQPPQSSGDEQPEPPADGRVIDAEPWLPEHAEDPLTVRRRTLFTRMVVTVAALFVAAVFLRGALWLAFLASVAVLGGYAAVLRRYKLQRDEARDVVRDLDADRLPPRPVRQPLAVGGEDFFSEIRAEHDEIDLRERIPSVRIRRWDA